jgi:hypothetical protein
MSDSEARMNSEEKGRRKARWWCCHGILWGCAKDEVPVMALKNMKAYALVCTGVKGLGKGAILKLHRTLKQAEIDRRMESAMHSKGCLRIVKLEPRS